MTTGCSGPSDSLFDGEAHLADRADEHERVGAVALRIGNRDRILVWLAADARA